MEKENFEFTLIPGQKVCDNCMTDINKQLNMYKYCYDAFQCHRQLIDHNLIKLDTETYKKYLSACNVKLNCGQNICSKCYDSIMKEIPSSVKHDQTSTSASTSSIKNICEVLNEQESESYSQSVSSSGSEFHTKSQMERNLDSKLIALGIPLIDKTIKNKSYLSNKAIDVLEETVDVMSNAMSSTLEIELPCFKNLRKLQNDSDSLQSLVNNILSKYTKETTKSAKIHMLTLLPENWTYSTVKEYFLDCSRYMWTEAQRLKANKGNFKISYVKGVRHL